jgi:glycosyltransferase involved in cell wall biosynthesis
VIVPCFNGAAYLREAIDSALQQVGVSFEVIAVDDGSTDASREVLASYGDRVRRIFQDNAGVARARNVGIAAARGEYVAFLDCDDVWLPHKLAAQLERFRQDPELGLVYADSEIFCETGVLVASKRRLRAPFEGNVLEPLFNDNFITTSSVVVRRKCLDDVGAFREDRRFATDYDLWLRLAERYRFGYVDRVSVRYRIRPGRLSDNSERRNLDDIALLSDCVRRVPGWSEKDAAVRRRFGVVYFKLGRRCLKAGEHAKSRAYLMQSLGYHPTNARAWLFLFLACLPRAVVRRLQAIRRGA